MQSKGAFVLLRRLFGLCIFGTKPFVTVSAEGGTAQPKAPA
jgi:hypothetical protein